MQKLSFENALELILKTDNRYDADAYHFVREALDFTIKNKKRTHEGPGKHVSGQELLEGIRLFALREYGPMAKLVLESWGIRRCEDFGEVVFNLVDKGVLGKTEKDSREDFRSGYDFTETFLKPYIPTIKLRRKSLSKVSPPNSILESPER